MRREATSGNRADPVIASVVVERLAERCGIAEAFADKSELVSAAGPFCSLIDFLKKRHIGVGGADQVRDPVEIRDTGRVLTRMNVEDENADWRSGCGCRWRCRSLLRRARN